MTETPYALAHDYALMVPAPDGVDAVISEVMARHQDELDAALEPFDVSLDDLVQATWMRFVRVGDVEALRSPSRDAAAAMRGAVDEGIAQGVAALAEACDPSVCDADCSMRRAEAAANADASRGGCCGSGEACSSAACTGTPRASAPAVDGVYMTDLLRDPEPFGERINPEPRNDAGVFGAPRRAHFDDADRAPMYGGRDEDGF